jgi:hypothetical protein
MILSTCNRTEIYLSAAEWLDGRNLFCCLIRDLHGFDMTDMQDQIYALRGAGKMGELAALHLREAGGFLHRGGQPHPVACRGGRRAVLRHGRGIRTPRGADCEGGCGHLFGIHRKTSTC